MISDIPSKLSEIQSGLKLYLKFVMPVLNVLSIFSIDATECKRLGKFVNDCAPTLANAKMKMININKIPYLCLFACSYGILAGTEIR